MKQNIKVMNLAQKMQLSDKNRLVEIDPVLISQELSVILLSIQKTEPKFFFLVCFQILGHHILLHLKLTNSIVTSV